MPAFYLNKQQRRKLDPTRVAERAISDTTDTSAVEPAIKGG
jgi:hypothetical protein